MYFSSSLILPDAVIVSWVTVAAPWVATVLAFALIFTGFIVSRRRNGSLRVYMAFAIPALALFVAGGALTDVANDAAQTAKLDTIESRIAPLQAWASETYDVDVSEHLAVELLNGRAGPSSEAGSVILDHVGADAKLMIVTSGLELPKARL